MEIDVSFTAEAAALLNNMKGPIRITYPDWVVIPQLYDRMRVAGLETFVFRVLERTLDYRDATAPRVALVLDIEDRQDPGVNLALV